MTNKGRVLTAVALVVALGGGVAMGSLAAGQEATPPPTRGTEASPAEMHERMRAHMPEDVRAECDQAHARMGDHMNGDTEEMGPQMEETGRMGSAGHLGGVTPMGSGGAGHMGR